MQWTRYTSDTCPPYNKRILISNGEIITIANLINDGNESVWIFENSNFKGLPVNWWRELPPMPPVITTQSAVLNGG